MREKGLAVINVTGKSGAGKTVFANRLKESLNPRGLHCERISTDDYFVRHPSTGGHIHDFDKLAADIESAKQSYQVVIIEGVIPTSAEKPKIEADYRVYFDSPLPIRLATRFYREHRAGERDAGEAMRQLAKGLGEQPRALEKYEAVGPEKGTNLLIRNNYELPEAPRLLVKNRKLILVAGGATVAEIELEEKQIEALNGIGIVTGKY